MAIVPHRLYYLKLASNSSTSDLTFTCSGSIPSHRVVKLNSNNTISLADNSDDSSACAAIGVSIQSGNNGDAIKVRLFGELENPLWSFTTDEPLFLNSSGQFSHSPLTSLFTLEVGCAISPTKIIIHLDHPIFA